MASGDGQVTYYLRVNDSKVSSDLDQGANTIEKNSGRIGGAISTLALAIGGAVVTAGGAAIKLGSDFESSMALVSTVFGTVKVDTDNLNEKMLALSDATGIAATSLGGTLYQALSAGVPVTEDMGTAMTFLEKSSRLAIGAGADLTTVVDTETSVMNAYRMSAEDLDKVQKILMQTQNSGKTKVQELGQSLSQVIPTAASVSFGFDQVAASLAVMTSSGVPTSQATTKLNQLLMELSKSGTSANDALKAATKGTEYAGKSFKQLMEAGVPVNDVLNLLGEYATKNGLSMSDMFSSVEASSAALLLSGQNTQVYTDTLAKMGVEADVVSDAFNTMSETTTQKFTRLVNSIKDVGIELFNDMEPIISELLPMFTNNIKPLLEPIMKLVEGLLPLFGESLKTLLPPLIQLANDVIPILVQVFDELVPPILKIVEDVLPIFTELLTILLEPLQYFADIIGDFLLGAFEALKPVMDEIVQNVFPILIELFDTLIPVLSDLAEAVLPIVVDVIKLFAEALKILIPYWQQIIDAILPVATSLFQSLMPIIRELADTLLPIFTDALKMLMGHMSKIIEIILPPLLKLFETFIPILAEIIASVLPPLIELFFKLIEPLLELIEMILPPIMELFNALMPIFAEVIEALMPLIDAILELVSVIFDALMPIIEPVFGLFADIIESLLPIIIPIIQMIADELVGLIEFLTGIFTGDWDKAWGGIKKIFTGIWNGITGVFKGVVNFFIDGLNKMFEALNAVKIPDWVPLVGGRSFHIAMIKHLRVGMDRVPVDEMPAILHRDEAVLTSDEAKMWRGLGGINGILNALSTPNNMSMDYMAMAEAIWSIAPDMGHAIIMNDREVARAVEPSLSTIQGNKTVNRGR